MPRRGVAPPVTTRSNPDHLEALAASLNAYDEAVKNLIRDELEATVRPGLEAARDRAAAGLEAAYAALKVPQGQIPELDAQIEHAEKN